MTTIDFPALAEKLLSEAPTLLRQWFPMGKQNGREFVIGNLHGDAGKSLSINIDTGIWKDFSTGTGSADLISLYAAMHNIKQGEAAKQLSNGHEVIAKDIYVIGQECHPLPRHKYGKPSNIFEYRNAQGQLVGYICRFDPLNEKKHFYPLTCWRKADGSLKWNWKKWPIASPIYHADKVAADLTAKVLIVEGEKKADRAQELLPAGWIAVGWCGGAEAVKGTDWGLLQGRECWIWPDKDAPGAKAAIVLKKILPHINIASVPDEFPEGWDLGDAEDGFDILKNLVSLPEPQPPQATPLPNNKSKILPLLEYINEEYAVILRGSQVLIMRHWIGEDGNGKLVFLNKRDFLLLQENNIVWIKDEDDNSKAMKIGPAWLEWKDRQGFEEVYFEPCGKDYKNRYNLWRGFAVKPNPAGKFDLFLTHIKDNICQGNEEHYAWVMAWLSDLFQKPGRKLGTALVLRGPMGIGKGQFAFHLGKLLGVHYMPITQSSQLTGKFNGHMADKLLMFVDEGWWSDERNGAGILRALITEPEVTIEMKGRDAITLPNFTRFMVAANADWVVPLGMGDERRFVIIDVGSAERGNKAYFAAIESQLKNGGYEALLHYFMNYKYDEALPRTVLKTEALCENKIFSMPDEMKWWHECLVSEKIGEFNLSNHIPNDIPSDKFYETYQKWCERMRIRPLTANILPKKLKAAVVNFNRSRKTVDAAGHKDWFYYMQTLEQMRIYFEEFLGHKIDWDGI